MEWEAEGHEEQAPAEDPADEHAPDLAADVPEAPVVFQHEAYDVRVILLALSAMQALSAHFAR